MSFSAARLFRRFPPSIIQRAICLRLSGIDDNLNGYGQIFKKQLVD